MDKERKVELLLQAGTPVYQDSLIPAIESACGPDTILALIRAGAQVNYWTKGEDKSILGRALAVENPCKAEIVKILIDEGAHVNDRDVLDNACECSAEILEMLIQAGSKGFTRDHVEQVLKK